MQVTCMQKEFLKTLKESDGFHNFYIKSNTLLLADFLKILEKYVSKFII